MENKINIAKILKNCPSGMELDCTMYDNLYFNQIYDDGGCIYEIGCYTIVDEIRTTVNFTKFGTFNTHANSKCVIFPKGKTTWEGYQRPFKDGDVAISVLGDIHLLRTKDSSYCAYRIRWTGLSKLDNTITTGVKVARLATEEEKQKLFDAIKANGYKWNAEAKTLEKLVEPKFKVGDIIKSAYKEDYRYIITHVTDTHYTIKEVEEGFLYHEPICEEKNWELVPSKFDITTLKPFESRVLVRDYYHQCWKVSFFGYFDKFMGKFDTVRGVYIQCIPYEGNEHLLGTSDDCDNFYKTWE